MAACAKQHRYGCVSARERPRLHSHAGAWERSSTWWLKLSGESAVELHRALDAPCAGRDPSVGTPCPRGKSAVELHHLLDARARGRDPSVGRGCPPYGISFRVRKLNRRVGTPCPRGKSAVELHHLLDARARGGSPSVGRGCPPHAESKRGASWQCDPAGGMAY